MNELEGAKPDQKHLSALMSTLGESEQARIAFCPMKFTTTETRGTPFEEVAPTVLLTTRRLLVTKPRTFGKPKIDWQMNLDQIASVGHGLQYGTGPRGEAHFETVHANTSLFIFVDVGQAEVFRNELQAAANGLTDESEQTDEPSSEESVFFRLLHGFLGDIGKLAVTPYIGKPFGEGSDLGEVISILSTYFANIEEVRSATQIMVTDLVMAGYDGVQDDLMAIMGADPVTLDASSLDLRVRENVNGLAGFALTLVSEIRESGRTLDFWRQNDEVAREVFCWYCVARLRMANKGLMPPVEKPDWIE